MCYGLAAAAASTPSTIRSLRSFRLLFPEPLRAGHEIEDPFQGQGVQTLEGVGGKAMGDERAGLFVPHGIQVRARSPQSFFTVISFE